jgi:hypothetical protein
MLRKIITRIFNPSVLVDMATAAKKVKRGVTNRRDVEKKKDDRINEIEEQAPQVAVEETSEMVQFPCYQIGQGRRVEVTLSDDRSYIKIKRFFTPEERLRTDAGDDGTVVALERVQVRKILHYESKLVRKCDKMLLGRSCDFLYPIGQDLHVSGQSGNYVVHIRRYWLGQDGEGWKPTKTGIAVRPAEFLSLVTLLPKIESEMTWASDSTDTTDSD